MSGDLKARTTCNLLIGFADVEKEDNLVGFLHSAALQTKFLPVTNIDLLVGLLIDWLTDCLIA